MVLVLTGGLFGCKSEPTLEEVLAKHRDAVALKLASVEIAATTIHDATATPRGGYSIATAPVFLHYPSPTEPRDPSANAAWAYEVDLVDLTVRGKLADRLRIPYSSILSECADALAGRTSSHPTYLDGVLGDCARTRYLFAIALNEVKPPYANPDGKTFTPGLLDTTVIVVDLNTPSALAGGFDLRVESSDTAFKQSDSRGPEGALMSHYNTAVRNEAKTQRTE